MAQSSNSSGKIILASQRGQIVFEYVLLLVIGLGVAALVTSTMVSRNPESPGFLIKKWLDMVKTVGGDTADDLKPADP